MIQELSLLIKSNLNKKKIYITKGNNNYKKYI